MFLPLLLVLDNSCPLRAIYAAMRALRNSAADFVHAIVSFFVTYGLLWLIGVVVVFVFWYLTRLTNSGSALWP